MSSSRSMDGREAAITVAPGRAAPGCGSVLAGGGGARGSGECLGATAPNQFGPGSCLQREGSFKISNAPAIVHEYQTFTKEKGPRKRDREKGPGKGDQGKGDQGKGIAKGD